MQLNYVSAKGFTSILTDLTWQTILIFSTTLLNLTASQHKLIMV